MLVNISGNEYRATYTCGVAIDVPESNAYEVLLVKVSTSPAKLSKASPSSCGISMTGIEKEFSSPTEPSK
jgi:hypothetical protein